MTAPDGAGATSTYAPGRSAGERPGASQGGAPGARHDPRRDPPTKADRHSLYRWVAFMAISPICLGGVVWAAISLNGSYPTVKPPVPRGWQPVAGIYASFSAPSRWTLQQALSDSAGDIYYSGPGGSAGESVTQAVARPSPSAPLPAILGTFLGDGYKVVSEVPYHLRNATEAWELRFALPSGAGALGVEAWAGATQSEVWLVVAPVSPLTREVLSTLTLAT